MDGEVTSAWAIADPSNAESKPIFLPGWFRHPIDRAILLWQEESRRWEDKKAKRLAEGRSGLAPKMQEAFDEWSATKSKTIVLNKKTHGQAVNFNNKPISQLKKSCLMITIHMSETAEGLAIQAGDGKLWQLKMMEGVLPAGDCIPPEVDQFTGLDLPPEEHDDEPQLVDEPVHGDADAFLHDEFNDGDDERDPDMNKWLLLEDSEGSDGSEEEEPPELLAKAFGTFTRARAVEKQPEFQRLAELGLAVRPPGCWLGIHPAAKVWRSASTGSPYFSRSFNPTPGRDAWQALLRVFELMLQSFLATNPKEKLVKHQLARIQRLRQEEPGHAD
ncbi:unnamed protein product [Durusdinium trenchii]|uniref:Uncharacterized protein n=1 Tax=Durusdinium trenchii TaxID=1381693 RepID=A0ABP0NDF9_9DINO